MNSLKPSAVVFRHIGKRELRSAHRWLRAGSRVLYLGADATLDLGGFEKLPPPRGIWPSAPAIALVESVYRAKIEGSRHLVWARKFFRSEDTRYAFLRSIMSRLLQCYYLMDSIRQVTGPQDLMILLFRRRFEVSLSWNPFVLEMVEQVRFGCMCAQDKEKIPDDIREVMGRIQARPVSRLRLLFLDLIGPTLFLRHIRLSSQPRQHADLAIHTYATGWGVSEESPDEPRLRNVDFIVDGIHFHPGNTVFWAGPGVPGIRIQALEKRGFRVVSVPSLRFDPRFVLRTVLPALGRYLSYRIGAGLQSTFEGLICKELLRTYVQTRVFAAYFTPRCFLLYNDFSDTSVARTIVLRSMGCRSIFYEHTSHSLIEGVEPDLAYLLYDVTATWGPAMTAYFQRPPGSFGESWEVGCIWSEHARMVREDSKLQEMCKERVEAHADQPLTCYAHIIGVFDTTVNPVLFTLEDFESFMSDIAWLASEFPEVCVLYKPKYAVKYMSGQWLEKFQGTLKKFHEVHNIVMLPSFFETSVVVGLADLTISACFTSTAVESIGCGARALYHDPLDRCPPGSEWGGFWNRIPGLICRSREQLRARVDELLYRTSEKEYRAYLRQHFSHVEGHQDGRAITRLRKRLLAEINGRL